MPTPSPLCLVADGAGPFNPTFPDGLDINPGDTVSITLQSPSGVTNWYLQIGLTTGNPPVVIPGTGTDELTITPPPLTGVNGSGLVTGGPTATVTFVFPNAQGRTLLFSSTVTGGFGAIFTTFALFTPTAGGYRVGATGMSREGSNAYGWAKIVNPAVRNIGGGAGPTGPAGGDLSGTYPNPAVAKVNGTSVPTTSGGDVGKSLQVTGAGAAAWQTITATGTAGGDLSGTYPNPTVAKVNGTTVPTTSGGDVGKALFVTAGGTAAWQTPSGTPTGPASEDLSGTYPGPTVAKINGAIAPPVANSFPGATLTVSNILVLSDMAVEPSGDSNPDTIWVLSEENLQGAYTGPADGFTIPTFLQFNVADSFENVIYSVVNDVLWVSGDNNNVYRIDKTTGNVIATVPFPVTITEMVEDPISGKVWCVTGGDTNVYRIDPGTNTIDQTTTLPGQSGNHITYSSTLGAVWVSLTNGHIVSVDSTSGSITHNVTVTSVVLGSIKSDPFNPKVWVGGQGNGTVYRVDEVGFVVDASFDLSTLTLATTYFGSPAVTIEAMAFPVADTLLVSVADAADVSNLVPITNAGAVTPTQQPANYTGGYAGHCELEVVNLGSGQTGVYGTFSYKDVIEVYDTSGGNSSSITMTSTLAYDSPRLIGALDLIFYDHVITPVLGTPLGFVAERALGPVTNPVVSGLAVTGTSATINAAKIQRGPTTIFAYGVSGRQQTANSNDEIGAVVFDPSVFYAGDVSLTRVIQLVAVLECAVGGQTASLELFNVDDFVTVTTVSTSNTTPTIVTSTPLAVPSDLPNSQKLYGLRLSRSGGTSSNLVTCKMARLEVILS